MSHQTFWKPEKKPKEKKAYSGLGCSKKVKKQVPDWKKGILAHHHSRPSRADRAEFPPEVVNEIKEETEGMCQCNCGRAATQTHHVMPRGRSGRGVKTNAMRVCDTCHDRIQINEDELQYWIEYYTHLHGDRFWFDEQDWDEYYRKQEAQRQKEQQKQRQRESINPVIELISTSAGRSLKAKEIKLIELMDEKQIVVFSSMINDIVRVESKHQIQFGYGYFDD
ncbi:HNH endonuclease [Paenibacillus sp. FSL K6-1230]|uniref:HNH endonuclease n=1 Tax=Paenibacillus sp. FSL K6-1230 TaxID=2921603 RepID=UPI0030F96C4B